MRLTMLMTILVLAGCAERQTVYDWQYRDLRGGRQDSDLKTDAAACRYQINSLPNNGVSSVDLLEDCMLARQWETAARNPRTVKQGLGI